MIVNLNLFYSPHNLILSFMVSIPDYFFREKKIYCHSFVCLISFPEAFITIQPVQTVVLTTQENQEGKNCLFTVVKGIPHPVPFACHFLLCFSHLKQLLPLNQTVLIKVSRRLHYLSSVFLFFKPKVYSPPLNS